MERNDVTLKDKPAPIYRAYFFGNFYLSSIQQGIQAAHCMAEMFLHYGIKDYYNQFTVMGIWANYDKTMICLNGGEATNLENIYNEIIPIAHILELPFAKFKEDSGLNNALTCVGIIVPDTIYDLKFPNSEFNSMEDFNALIEMGLGKKLPPEVIAKYSLKNILDKYHLAR
jgi:hypothetical protein